ncbi:grpE nucleotide exchange factor [Artemisia annua]|uniref:GrpE protein homolog n=1 Tax=Artemisia annua TaxID=35608 RepID=A0A2U1NDL6_ARTAN|nr:grpE nucleotide exchange factor [Artemisia annua]
MAALPLTNFCTPSRIVHQTPFRTSNLAFKPQSYKPICGFSRSLTNSYLGQNWGSFRPICASKNTTVEQTSEDEAEIDDLEESESDAEQESILTVKSLLQLYKQAVLTEDDTTASDIEATLTHLENEKNMLLEKVAALSADTGSGKERLIRLQADFENFRKRSEKERLNVRSDAQGEVIESLLPMVDNFERAKQQLKLETDQEKKIDASYQGIYKQFVEIMRSLRVAVVPTVGKAFDPAIHEAIAREESKEFNEGIVIEEFRRGFILGERLLRPAMVKVSAGPGRPKSPAAEASTDSNEQQTADLSQ